MAAGRSYQLLGSFVGGQAVGVERVGSAERRLLPWVGGDADDGALGEVAFYGPGVGKLGDAQIGGPGVVLAVPARVDVVEACLVAEVGAVDGELVVGVELGFEGVV